MVSQLRRWVAVGSGLLVHGSTDTHTTNTDTHAHTAHTQTHTHTAHTAHTHTMFLRGSDSECRRQGAESMGVCEEAGQVP